MGCTRASPPPGNLLSSTPLTLAETACIFGESLTFRKLLANAPRPRRARSCSPEGRGLLNTVVRQIAFYDFESRLHAERRNGELSPDDIGAIWMRCRARASARPSPSCRLQDLWACIPHFIHSPFYVYAYAFGEGW